MSFGLEFPSPLGGEYPPPPPTEPPSGGMRGLGAHHNHSVTLHTYKGVTLTQYSPDQMFSLGWGREKNKVSTSSLSIASDLYSGKLPNIVPWLHWISVYDTDTDVLQWTGPIQDFQGNRDQLTINASDIGALFKRDVCPMTKDWEALDPGYIAKELLETFIDQHGLSTGITVRPDPRVDKFDFSCEFESEHFDQTMESLVAYGLTWAVVKGRMLLGPRSFKSLESLSEDHFIGGSPVFGRDGRDMATEIILRAPKTIARAKRNRAGLNLKRIVDVDSMFSVSNAQRAAEQYVTYTSRPRDVLMLPGNIRLSSEAPIHLDQLVPTARFTIESYGITSLMELVSMQAENKQGDLEVTVTMTGVDDEPPELQEFATAGGSLGL